MFLSRCEQLAFDYFKDRINVYSKRGLTDGFRRIDNDHKGSLSGDELKMFFMEEAHCPWYCNDRTIACLVDFADLNDDDSIGYLELSQVLARLQDAPLRPRLLPSQGCFAHVGIPHLSLLCTFSPLPRTVACGSTDERCVQVLECDDLVQFAALVPQKKAKSQDKKDREMKIGTLGCTVGQVKDAQWEIVEKLLARCAVMHTRTSHPLR